MCVYVCILWYARLKNLLCLYCAGITNAKFICGKAEDVIKEQLSHVSGDNVIAILDPPRGGVRK